MRLQEYTRCDGVGLADLVRRCEISPAELMQTAQAAIAAVDPAVNAVVTRLDERAEKKLQSLPRGPFEGVPFLFKDMLDLEGTPVSYGSRLLLDNRSTATHEVLRRFEETGLVVLGRTNMSELGLLPQTEPDHRGPTRNPWHQEYSPGGSSGGSAAAVAAGIVPMAHGADGGGSIRIPASACGVFGLKPSRGRLPADVADDADGFVVNGVITRTVRDSAAMLDAIAGATHCDRFRLPPPERPYREVVLARGPRLHVAWTAVDFTGQPVHPDCRAAIERTAALLADLGHTVEEAAPAIDGQAFFEAFEVLWAMVAGHFLQEVQHHLTSDASVPWPLRRLFRSRRLLRLALGFPPAPLGQPKVELFTRRLAELDASLTPADVWRAWTNLRRAEVRLLDFLERRDLFLTPVLGEPPWRTGSFDPRRPMPRLREQLMRYVAFTPIANTAGLPAMSVPLYWNGDGLPIGSHFIAPLGREDRLFALAAELEEAAPWRDRHPPVFAGA